MIRIEYSRRFASLFFFLLFISAAAVVNGQNNNHTAVYRLLNSQSGRHFYTQTCSEKNDLAQSGAYVYEGAVFYVATRQNRRAIPLHRIMLGNGAHFYTTSQQEMQNVTRDPANRYESVVGYVAESQQRNTVPLYRLMAGDRYFYTTSEREKNVYLQNPDSRLEGIAGYVWTSGTNKCDGNFAPPASGNFPVIYAGTNFDGAATAVERDQSELRDWDGSPHTIRSLRVPQGWYLVLYTRSNFRGESYDVSSNLTFAPGDRWYNKIRSIKVYQGAPPRQPR